MKRTSFLSISFMALIAATMLACGPENSDSNKDKDGINPDSALSAELPVALTADSLTKAQAANCPVFLVITGTGATGVEKASILVREAAVESKNAKVYSLNRDHAANADLVTRFGIATVPLPFILVISPHGVPVTGGQPAQFTAAQLVQSIPSPSQDEVYLALMEKKPVFIVVSQKGYQDKEAVLSTCKTAAAQIKDQAAIIEVDFDDPGEKSFLSQIGIKVMNGITVTVVSNAAGQIVETINAKPTVNQLINSAAKVIKQSGGCCPTGSGKGC